MSLNAELLSRMESFRAAYEKKLGEYYASRYANCPAPSVSLEHGGKYTRVVVTTTGHRSAYGFLEHATGSVLKAASWKAPAKNGERGNLNSHEYGLEGFGPFGALYKGANAGW